MGSICGNDSMPSAKFSTKQDQQLLIVLRQREIYPQNGHTGFLVTIATAEVELKPVDACWFGPEMVFEERTIESPAHYARADYYPNSMACQWHVKAPCDYQIKGKVTKFYLWTMRNAADRLTICDSAVDYGLDGEDRDWKNWYRRNQHRYGYTNHLCRQMMWFTGDIDDDFIIPDNIYCDKSADHGLSNGLRVGKGEGNKEEVSGWYDVWEAKAGHVWQDCYRKGKCACNFHAAICRAAKRQSGFWWWFPRYYFANGWKQADYDKYCHETGPSDNYVWGSEWMVKFESGPKDEFHGFTMDVTFHHDPTLKDKGKREVEAKREYDVNAQVKTPEMRAVS